MLYIGGFHNFWVISERGEIFFFFFFSLALSKFSQAHTLSQPVTCLTETILDHPTFHNFSPTHIVVEKS